MQEVILIIGAAMSLATLTSAQESSSHTTKSITSQVATTRAGKEVLIKSDGTWEYVKLSAPKNVQFEFRKTNWGASKSKVKASEKFKLQQEETNALFYEGHVASLPVLLAYVFVNDKLVRAKYIFTQEHSNKNSHIIDFDSIKDELSKKYGVPKSDDTLWRNDLYKDDYSNWGLAIAVGHLIYATQWETDSTKLGLFLKGDNYEISLVAEYISKELEALEDNLKSKKTQDDL